MALDNPTSLISVRRSPSSLGLAARRRGEPSTRASALRRRCWPGSRRAVLADARAGRAHARLRHHDDELAAADRVSAITPPVLILTSEGSGERLPTWARWLRETLPNASLRTLEGEWHGVARRPRSRTWGVLHPRLVAAYIAPTDPRALLRQTGRSRLSQVVDTTSTTAGSRSQDTKSPANGCFCPS